jgi:DNA mismatch repair ATPase MutS
LVRNASFSNPIDSTKSILGLLDNTRSYLGKQLLKKWVLRPLQSKEDIEERLRAVDFMILPTHQTAIQEIRKSLKQVKNIPVS